MQAIYQLLIQGSILESMPTWVMMISRGYQYKKVFIQSVLMSSTGFSAKSSFESLCYLPVP